MNLPKAIEIGIDHSHLMLVDKNPDLKKSMLLLIQAGKRCQRQRIELYPLHIGLLPGETKD